MEDLYRAGGLLAVLREVADLLDPDGAHRHRPPAGRPPGEARIWDETVIRPRSAPLQEKAGIAVLRGQPGARRRGDQAGRGDQGTAAHRGPAVVFDSIEDLRARLDDPDLDVDEDSVLVLRGCGPRGYPGMPEVGNMPMPAKLLARGVRDMVRICDARMSGTAYGTVVLHTLPEGAAGGPLALVRDGDSDRAGRARPPAGPRPARGRNSAGAAAPAMTAALRGPAAAGNGCTSITSCRPDRAPTWTSWSAPAATRSPATPTEGCRRRRWRPVRAWS